MAKLMEVTGMGTYPKAFADLTCPYEGVVTRHSQRRVIAHWPGQRFDPDWQILVRC